MQKLRGHGVCLLIMLPLVTTAEAQTYLSGNLNGNYSYVGDVYVTGTVTLLGHTSVQSVGGSVYVQAGSINGRGSDGVPGDANNPASPGDTGRNMTIKTVPSAFIPFTRGNVVISSHLVIDVTGGDGGKGAAGQGGLLVNCGWSSPTNGEDGAHGGNGANVVIESCANIIIGESVLIDTGGGKGGDGGFGGNVPPAPGLKIGASGGNGADAGIAGNITIRHSVSASSSNYISIGALSNFSAVGGESGAGGDGGSAIAEHEYEISPGEGGAPGTNGDAGVGGDITIQGRTLGFAAERIDMNTSGGDVGVPGGGGNALGTVDPCWAKICNSDTETSIGGPPALVLASGGASGDILIEATTSSSFGLRSAVLIANGGRGSIGGEPGNSGAFIEMDESCLIETCIYYPAQNGTVGTQGGPAGTITIRTVGAGTISLNSTNI